MTATILQFPKRNKGRVRKTESMRAGGEMALGFLGIEAPEGVVILDRADAETVYAEETTQLLALALFFSGTDDLRRRVRQQVEIAYEGAPTRDKRRVAARLRQIIGQGR